MNLLHTGVSLLNSEELLIKEVVFRERTARKKANIFEILILADEKRETIARETTDFVVGLAIQMNNNTVFSGSH